MSILVVSTNADVDVKSSAKFASDFSATVTLGLEYY